MCHFVNDTSVLVDQTPCDFITGWLHFPGFALAFESNHGSFGTTSVGNGSLREGIRYSDNCFNFVQFRQRKVIYVSVFTFRKEDVHSRWVSGISPVATVDENERLDQWVTTREWWQNYGGINTVLQIYYERDTGKRGDTRDKKAKSLGNFLSFFVNHWRWTSATRCRVEINLPVLPLPTRWPRGYMSRGLHYHLSPITVIPRLILMGMAHSGRGSGTQIKV
jgi:hypothetical protein